MKITKSQLIKLLGGKITENLTKSILEQTKRELELKLEADFDMDDFFFNDAEAAARADMQQHYGDSMVHAKLGDKEDTKAWLQGQMDANDSEVDKYASHLKNAEQQTFNQELVNFLTRDHRLADLRDNDPHALLDTIGLAAYKYVMDNNSASPFISALQEWLIDLNHEFDPTEEDLTEVDPMAYRLLKKFEPIYNKKADIKRLNEALFLLENDQMPRYYSIVFLQGEEANETMQIMDEQGNEAALAHLLQNYYDQDEVKALDDDRYKGNMDHEFRQVVDGETYIMIWNSGIPYVGLVEMRMQDAPDLSDEKYKDLYDDLHGTYGELEEGNDDKTYEYHINLNERGQFYADVRDENGHSVFTIKIGYGEEEDSNPIEDGYMKHTRDIAGLESYLKDLGIIGHGSKIISPYGLREDDIIGDPSSVESATTIDDVSKGYYVVPPAGNDPLWYVADQAGKKVSGHNTEDEAKQAVQDMESDYRPTGGLAPVYGVDFKESRIDYIDNLLNEALSLIEEYRSTGGYPAGAEHDPRAPWNIADIEPAKRKPKQVFSLTDSNRECVIMHHGGSYYVFYKDGLEPDQSESIAIDYIGVPSEVEKDEDGYNTVYDASEYRNPSHLTGEAIVDYVNDNFAHLKVGNGLEAWESGMYDLVRIDQPLAQELKSMWTSLSVPIS